MLTIAAEARSAEAAAPRGIDALRIEVVDSLAAAEGSWRALDATAVTSPYQRFRWVSAFAAAAPAGAVRVATVTDGSGRSLLVLPLVVTRRLGVTVATGIGGKHANFQVPAMAPNLQSKLDDRGAAALLRRIGRKVGADTLALTSVPRQWGGAPNPFAGAGQPSPSNASEVRLDPDPEATAQRSMTNEARKRLRNKERGLAKLGPVSLWQAQDPDGVERLLAAFHLQKEERFRELGIPDPFLDPEIRDGIRHGALEGLSVGRPAIELYGLQVGEHITAILGGAADNLRLSGMFISFASCQEVTKFSPGDILVSRIIREQCLRGRRYFDLGVGEARYKRTFCNETVDLVDVFLPVTVKGRVYAAGAQAALGLKRQIKQNPQAMALVGKLRRAKAHASA